MFKLSGFDMLSLGTQETLDLQAVINRWEKYYIYNLLSNNTPTYTLGLADQFVADASANNGVPVIPRFVKIFNSFNEMSGGKRYSSLGMLDVFKSLIFYHYITEKSTWNTTGGMTSSNATASKSLSIADQYRGAEKRFNDALNSINAIQWWLQSGNGNGGGASQYPEYIAMYDYSVGEIGYSVGNPFTAKYQSIL